MDGRLPVSSLRPLLSRRVGPQSFGPLNFGVSSRPWTPDQEGKKLKARVQKHLTSDASQKSHAPVFDRLQCWKNGQQKWCTKCATAIDLPTKWCKKWLFVGKSIAVAPRFEEPHKRVPRGAPHGRHRGPSWVVPIRRQRPLRRYKSPGNEMSSSARKRKNLELDINFVIFQQNEAEIVLVEVLSLFFCCCIEADLFLGGDGGSRACRSSNKGSTNMATGSQYHDLWQ